MSERRVIRKYPNRRLYDTIASRYIALRDIRNLIADRIEIVVISTQDHTDITNLVLLQVLVDEQEAGNEVLDRALLVQLIRQAATQANARMDAVEEEALLV